MPPRRLNLFSPESEDFLFPKGKFVAEIEADLLKSAVSDQLADTVDYVHLNKIVVEEMAIRSKLLEHVAKRIITRVFREIPEVSRIVLEVSKINPPIGGDVEQVTIVMEEYRA